MCIGFVTCYVLRVIHAVQIGPTLIEVFITEVVILLKYVVNKKFKKNKK